jgi:hypothetical protein
LSTLVYYYRLTQNGKTVDKIKVFPNCTEEEANEKWNSFMENHNYSGKVELIKTKNN